MKHKRVIKTSGVAIAFILLSSGFTTLPAQADRASEDNAFSAGIRYFRNKDYSSAAGYLKRAVEGKYRHNPSAHYWYGSALLKENRIDDAMIAFAEAYSLSPHTTVGENSLKTLKLYKDRIKESKKLSSFVAGKLRKKPRVSAPQAYNVPKMSMKMDMGDDPESQVDQAKLRSVKNRLKPVRKHVKAGPTLSQFNSWPVTQQANYVYAGAFQAISRARSNLSSAQQQLKEAKLTANQLVPTFRSYGDSDTAFKNRKEASKKVYELLLQPYRKELKLCTEELQEAITIKNRAEQALNTPLYYYPGYYGGGIYR